MFKKLILVAVAAISVHSFGGGQVPSAPSKPVAVPARRDFKVTYIPGPVSPKIANRCTSFTTWSKDDEAWLEQDFANAPCFSLIKKTTRPAVRFIHDVFKAQKNTCFSCVFNAQKKNVFVVVTYTDSAVTVEVHGESKENPVALMVLLETMITQKTKSNVISGMLKGVGVFAAAVVAGKIFVVDPLVKKHNDAALLEKEKKERQDKLEKERQDKLKAAAKTRIAAQVRRFIAKKRVEEMRRKPGDTKVVGELLRGRETAFSPIVLEVFYSMWKNIFFGKYEQQKASADRRLSLMLDDLTPLQHKNYAGISVFDMNGIRSYQTHSLVSKLDWMLYPAPEDALDVYETDQWLVCGVYDGHGGQGVSNALSGFFLGDEDRIFVQNDSYRLTKRLAEVLTVTSGSVSEIITNVFKKVDDELIEKFAHKNPGSVERTSPGSTAVLFLFDKSTGKAYLVNLGDSRADVIDERGNVFLETQDHQPKCFSCHNDGHIPSCEVARIIAMGEVFSNGRIGGDRIAVSRSFGDAAYKISPNRYLVGIVPDVYEIDLNRAQYVVLACDGLWEARDMTKEGLFGFIQDAKQLNHNPAEYLCKKAFFGGSRDNISTIVIDTKVLFAHVGAAPTAGSAGSVSGFGDSDDDGDAGSRSVSPPGSRRGSTLGRDGSGSGLLSVYSDDRCTIYSKACDRQDGLDCGFHASCNADSIQSVIEGKSVDQHLALIAEARLKTKAEIQEKRDESGLRAEHSCLQELGVVSFVTKTLENTSLHASTTFVDEETQTTFLCLPEFTTDKKTVEEATELLARITCDGDIFAIKELMRTTTRKSGSEDVPNFESTASRVLASRATISMQELKGLRSYLTYIKDMVRGQNMVGKAVEALKAGKTVIMPWLSHALDASRVREGASLRGVSTNGIGHWTCKVFIPEISSAGLSKVNVVDVDSLSSGGLGVYQSVRSFIDFCFKNDGDTRDHAITLIRIFGKDRCDQIMSHFSIVDRHIA